MYTITMIFSSVCLIDNWSADIFNCYQRAHQNTLEFVPYFYPTLLTAGLRHPVGAAIAGAIFVLGRVIYALGYYSGDPQKRVPGALISEVLGLLPLMGMSVSGKLLKAKTAFSAGGQ